MKKSLILPSDVFVAILFCIMAALILMMAKITGEKIDLQFAKRGTSSGKQSIVLVVRSRSEIKYKDRILDIDENSSELQDIIKNKRVLLEVEDERDINLSDYLILINFIYELGGVPVVPKR